MRDARRIVLVLLAELLSVECVAGESQPLGWLPELAGRCWNNAQFGSQVCYWQSGADQIRFLSRSGDRWLDCGMLVATTASSGIVSVSWSETAPGDSLQLRLSGDTLLMREGRPAYPEGVDRQTVMTRPRNGRFSIYRHGQYGPGGRHAGQEQIRSTALVFRVGKSFGAADPAARRCVALQGSHAQIP